MRMREASPFNAEAYVYCSCAVVDIRAPLSILTIRISPTSVSPPFPSTKTIMCYVDPVFNELQDHIT